MFILIFLFFFGPTDRPTHLHEREGDGKRNILLGWPCSQLGAKITWQGYPRTLSLNYNMYCLIYDYNWLNNLFLPHCCLFVLIFFFLLNFVTSYAERNISRKWSRKKPANFTSSQEKVKSLKEVREKWNFKSTYLFFEQSVDMDRFVLVENCPWKGTTSPPLAFQGHPFFRSLC